MKIRKSKKTDLPAIMQIFAEARAFMWENGNMDQWKNNHPPQELIEEDIQRGVSYVCVIGEEVAEEIAAVFYFNIERDITYSKIDGKWVNDEPYGVIHRIARSMSVKGAKGAGEFCIKWCLKQHPNIRIDTHRDNAPLLRLMDKLGFTRCGIIWLANGDERVAFQKAE